MSDEAANTRVSNQQWAIELLARETDVAIEEVEEIYTIEHAKLEQVARIKAFVPVLTSRRVRMILHSGHGTTDSASAN